MSKPISGMHKDCPDEDGNCVVSREEDCPTFAQEPKNPDLQGGELMKPRQESDSFADRLHDELIDSETVHDAVVAGKACPHAAICKRCHHQWQAARALLEAAKEALPTLQGVVELVRETFGEEQFKKRFSGSKVVEQNLAAAIALAEKEGGE